MPPTSLLTLFNFHSQFSIKRFSSLSSLSLHYKIHRFSAQANGLLTIVRDQTTNTEAAKPFNTISPSLALGYKLFKIPDISLRLIYKDIFRMPTFNDLYYDLIGNNKLNPEYTKQYSAGIVINNNFKNLAYISFNTDIFYNHVKDKIIAVPTKNLFVWSMRNIGIVDIKGIELQTNFYTTIFSKTKLSLNATYTYQSAMDMTDKQSPTYKNQIAYIPYETFTTMTSLEFKPFTLSYNLLFNGYRYALDENIYDNMIPGWWTHDISASYIHKFKSFSAKIKFDINNLLDYQYEVIRSFPMPGRAYNISLIFTY